MRISDWSSDVCSSDLPGGLVLGSASIGDNVTIFQNVTLGARHFDGGYNLSRRPVLHARVTVGAGAVILGPVTIGEGATVAANSLVLADVPPGYTAMGVPAATSPSAGKNPDTSVPKEVRSEERRVGNECGSRCKLR